MSPAMAGEENSGQPLKFREKIGVPDLHPWRRTWMSRKWRNIPCHPHRRRSNDPGTFVVEAPFLFCGGGVERIEIGIAAAEVHDPVHYRRGRLDADLVVNLVVLSCLEAPLFFSGGSVDGVEVAVPTPDKNGSLGDRRRGVERRRRYETSTSACRCWYPAHRYCHRRCRNILRRSIPPGRQVTVEGIGILFGRGLGAMQVFSRRSGVRLRSGTSTSVFRWPHPRRRSVRCRFRNRRFPDPLPATRSHARPTRASTSASRIQDRRHRDFHPCSRLPCFAATAGDEITWPPV